MKYIKLLLVLLFLQLNVKSQDVVILQPDSGIDVVFASAKQLILPPVLKSYAGIRFVDVRCLKDFNGFLPSFNDKKLYKLKTQNSFEEEINNINIFRKDDVISKVDDSIIVLIKNLWFNRNPAEKSKVYCHVAALFFIKKSNGVYYDYKIDTFFNYKSSLGDFYKTSIDKVISDLMLSYTKPEAGLVKKYTIDEFSANVQKKRCAPQSVLDSTGVFLSYRDFLNGNLYKTEVSVNPFFDQFTFTIKDDRLNVKLHKSIWGIMYAGSLYVRTENLLCKAFIAEGTYMTRGNIEIRGASSGNYAPVYSDATNNTSTNAAMSLGSAAIINLLQSKKAKIKSYPLILNIETGELE